MLVKNQQNQYLLNVKVTTKKNFFDAHSLYSFFNSYSHVMNEVEKQLEIALGLIQKVPPITPSITTEQAQVVRDVTSKAKIIFDKIPSNIPMIEFSSIPLDFTKDEKTLRKTNKLHQNLKSVLVQLQEMDAVFKENPEIFNIVKLLSSYHFRAIPILGASIEKHIPNIANFLDATWETTTHKKQERLNEGFVIFLKSKQESGFWGLPPHNTSGPGRVVHNMNQANIFPDEKSAYYAISNHMKGYPGYEVTLLPMSLNILNIDNYMHKDNKLDTVLQLIWGEQYKKENEKGDDLKERDKMKQFLLDKGLLEEFQAGISKKVIKTL